VGVKPGKRLYRSIEQKKGIRGVPTTIDKYLRDMIHQDIKNTQAKNQYQKYCTAIQLITDVPTTSAIYHDSHLIAGNND
jgi:hypothetical protein